MRLVCAHCGTKAKVDAEKCASCGSTDLQPPDAGGGGAPPRRRTSLTLAMGAVVVAVPLCICGVGGVTSYGLLGSAPIRQDGAGGADGFDAVRARGSLRVGVDPDSPPFLQRTPDGWEGFEYAVISAIGSARKVPVELVAVPYDDLLGAVADGEVDLAIAQLPPQQRTGVVFSRSYLQYTLCLVTRADDARAQLAAFRGRPVGLYRDPTAMAALEAHGVFQERFYSDTGYFADLAAGEIEAVVYDCPLARHELRTDPAAPLLRIADDHVDVATYSVAVSAAAPALRAEVDAVLSDLGTSGLFPQLASRWLGEAPPGEFQGAASRVVVVRPGEDLAALASRASVTTENLVSWNGDILGSGPPAVYPGMMLRVR